MELWGEFWKEIGKQLQIKNEKTDIGFTVLERLDKLNLTRIEFAERMNVSPQLVEKCKIRSN